jgi:hypothetical protein
LRATAQPIRTGRLAAEREEREAIRHYGPGETLRNLRVRVDQLGRQPGRFLGPYAMGVVQDATGSFPAGLFVIAMGSVVAGRVVLALGNDRRLEHAPQAA